MLLKGYIINDKRFCGLFVEIVENCREIFFDLGLFPRNMSLILFRKLLIELNRRHDKPEILWILWEASIWAINLLMFAFSLIDGVKFDL